jgi:hypothetical protein
MRPTGVSSNVNEWALRWARAAEARATTAVAARVNVRSFMGGSPCEPCDEGEELETR